MRPSEKGQALISVIAGVSLVLLSLVVALIITQFSGRVIHRQLLYQGQALNAAQAGLTEGLSWFRRQVTQPVSTFYPVRDLAAIPQINDTEDPNCTAAGNNACVGLVRNYQVSGLGNVWARYELRRTRRAGDVMACDPVTEKAPLPNPPSTPCYLTQTLDITQNRGKSGSGVVWQLEADGVIYARHDPNQGPDFNRTAGNPNDILARRRLRAEIQRLGITPPADGALITSRSDAVNLPNTDVRIDGTSRSAIAWVNSPAGQVPNGAGYSPPAPPNTQIRGTAPVTTSGIPASPSRFTIPYIFGLTEQELRASANRDAGCRPPGPFPNPCIPDLDTDGPNDGVWTTLPNMNLIVLSQPGNANQTFRFDSQRPLTGTGILVVFGNLDIAANSLSNYNGIIFVRGRYSQRQPSTINGTVIIDAPAPVGGVRPVSIAGSGEDSVIRYDRNLIDFIARRMGLYDVARSAYVPCKPGELCDE
jgi:hypothetical protein